MRGQGVLSSFLLLPLLSFWLSFPLVVKLEEMWSQVQGGAGSKMFHLLSSFSRRWCCCCCCCCPFDCPSSCCKTCEARSRVGQVVRCSIYYPALLAARMTERCATKLSVSTPVPLSDLLTKMRRRSRDWNLGNLEVWKSLTSAIQLMSKTEDQC